MFFINLSIYLDKMAFSYILTLYFNLEILYVMGVFHIINELIELFTSISILIIFISLFELYYKHKNCLKKDIRKSSIIRIGLFFVFFFLLFSLVNFYIT